MKPRIIAFVIGLGATLGAILVINPLLFMVLVAILLATGILFASPYVGAVLIVFIAPFQPFIRELVGNSLVRFWREALLLTILCGAAAKIFRERRRFPIFHKSRSTTHVLWAVMLYLGYLVLRAALGPYELQTISGLTEYCLYSLLFFACLLLLRNTKQVIGIFFSISAVAVLMALGGIWESINGGRYIVGSHIIIDRSTFPRSASFMESPLELGCFLALSFPMILTCIHETKTRLKRNLMIIAAIIVIIGLGTTGSRGPWLQFIVSISAYVAIYPGLSSAKRLKALVVVVFVLISALISISLAFRPVSERLASITDWQRDEGNLERIQQWKTAFDNISESPIIGKGLGSISRLRGSSIADYDLAKARLLVQESLILKTWLQVGLLGLFFFIYLYVAAIKCAYASRKLRDMTQRFLGLCITSCLLGLIIEIVTTETLHSWAINMIFWYLIAISCLIGSDKLKTDRRIGTRRSEYPERQLVQAG
jgi:hypothetical protein